MIVTRMQLVAGIAGVAGFVVVLLLLRRGQLREKYVALWLFLGAVTAVLGFFPGLLDDAARLLHVADAPNLLLFCAVWVLLLIVVHLSWELSRLEERTRTLAEEIAFLRMAEERRSGSPASVGTEPAERKPPAGQTGDDSVMALGSPG